MKNLKSLLYLIILVALLAIPVIGITAASAAEHNPESIVRWCEDWPTYIDPAVGTDFSDTMAIVQLYDTLIFPNLDGSVRPHVAEKWDISDDFLTYTFYLRKGVKFHNGDELTAEDVVFSTERLFDIGEGFAYILQTKDAQGKIIAGIESVKAIDDYTVEFKLARPFGPFVPALVRLYILNKSQVMKNIDKSNAMYGEMGDYGKKWLLTNDAGSGPYKVKEMKMEESLLGEKFDDYWDGWEEGAPDFFKEFAFPGEVAIRTMMKNQELEITSETLPMEAYAALREIPGVETIAYLSTHNLQIMLNTRVPPTDDIHFRKALSWAMDYDVVVNDIWPYYVQSVGPVPQTLPGHNKDVLQYSYNLEKAKEEMAKSAYAGKENIPFTLSWCAEVPDEEKVALLFQVNAAEIGIDVEIFKKPFGLMIDDAQTVKTTPNGSVVYVAAHYNEAGSMLDTRYHSKSQGTWEQCEWLGSPNIDTAIEVALATVDEDERFKEYAEIQNTLVDLAPTIWLADQALEFGYQADYLVWPLAERVKAGKSSSPPMGYSFYVRDMKILVEKKAELLKK
ncbi:MAG: ABC transporter substrate-binding protein [Deltaproteobacteria bacterium]|nr:ABC transporter substrate-binding protein [Deltaproteobacteria bacterium]